MPPSTSAVAIDEIIDRALSLCGELPESCDEYRRQIEELRSRLTQGRLHLAVLGLFNRGKSTFINALLGLRILPTSVLPLTSVPTVIRYGPELACTISFSGETRELRGGSSPESVPNLLLEYVTEEHNPRNRARVAEATVECPSPLLHNGTVLIDTPGFGSTYVHNTRTTEMLLEECDAAFFVLSADLPITNSEIEFLRKARAFVPRVFYVFNKMDLLTPDERRRIDDFVQGVIVEHFGYSADCRFFPVCARNAEACAGEEACEDTLEKSGMTAVHDEIQRFMAIDKLFTLSHALDKKFKEALSGIDNHLEEQERENHRPLEELEETLSELQRHIEQTLQGADKEARVTEAERDALHRFLDTTMKEEAEWLDGRLMEVMEEALLSVGGPPGVVLKTVLPHAFRDISARAGLRAREALNRPLRRAAAAHARELEQIASAARTIAPRIPPASADPSAVHESLELDEMIAEPDTAELAGRIDRMRFPFKARMAHGHARIDRCRPQLEELAEELRQQSCWLIDTGLRHRIDEVCGKFSELLQGRFTEIRSAMEEVHQKRSRELEQERRKREPVLKRLAELKEGFAAVRDMLP